MLVIRSSIVSLSLVAKILVEATPNVIPSNLHFLFWFFFNFFQLLKQIGPLNCLYYAVKSIFSINLIIFYLISFLLDSKQRQNSYMQMSQGPHWRSLQQMLTRPLLVKSLW